jgi:hypothetical protein
MKQTVLYKHLACGTSISLALVFAFYRGTG